MFNDKKYRKIKAKDKNKNKSKYLYKATKDNIFFGVAASPYTFEHPLDWTNPQRLKL